MVIEHNIQAGNYLFEIQQTKALPRLLAKRQKLDRPYLIFAIAVTANAFEAEFSDPK